MRKWLERVRLMLIHRVLENQFKRLIRERDKLLRYQELYRRELERRRS